MDRAAVGLMPNMTLVELKAAYDSGQVTEPLILDNDQTTVYTDSGKIFEAHPYDLLRSALDILGIPWDEA